MGNLYITVEEFMKQIGNSHIDVEPSVYIAYMSWKNKNKETAN